ncbi:MAG: hypothetical protein IT269_03710 [Saprospiraceae bacterium]|nr:hypothetical protein [Saprospiraceae bacterium]
MTTSALLEIFNALNGRQLKAAREWVASPAFNQRAEVLRLFDYLMQSREANIAPDTTRAIAVVFPSGKGALPKLRHEMSALTDVLRQFLVWQELQEEEGYREWLLLRATRKLGLTKNFHLAEGQLEEVLKNADYQSIEQPFVAFRLGMEQYEWAARAHREQEDHFSDIRNELDAWYVGQLLRLVCMEQAQQSINSRTQGREKQQIKDLDPLLAQIPGRPDQTRPAIAMYRLGQAMLANPDDGEHMEAYRQLLAQHIGIVLPSEARNLLMLAINHGIRRINAGDRSAIRRTLEFYLLGLERRVLHDDRGVLSKYTYNNVLMTFLALGEWAEAANFLDQYRNDLAANERDNIYLYNRAIYFFRKGEYDNALELLRDVSFSDPMYKLESRRMLLKIYYEQESFDALESLLENFLLWIRRHGEIGYHREMYRNLVVFTGKLLRLPPGASDARKRLEKKIQETPLVAERAWLLQQVRKSK